MNKYDLVDLADGTCQVVKLTATDEIPVSNKCKPRTANLLIEQLETLEQIQDLLFRKQIDFVVTRHRIKEKSNSLAYACADTHGHDVEVLLARLNRVIGALTAPEIQLTEDRSPEGLSLEQHHDQNIDQKIQQLAKFNNGKTPATLWERLSLRIHRAWNLIRSF